jgi:DNA invertase Pin-like site-specific DNA recombinase
MNNTNLIKPHHLSKIAVVYIRQSSLHQVQTNTESQRLQRMMKEQALLLGWNEDMISVIDADTGKTAATTDGREAFKSLLGDIALGRVGMVLSYESTRLSRNCTDWYPLLDICAVSGCLLADCDGVYDPSSFNGRLLLGMKGIISEFELHTLRGRMLAGLQSKAERGELALALPSGLIRTPENVVIKEPDLQVQHAIQLVFSTFLQVKSAIKVMKFFRENGLLLPRKYRNRENVWKPPTYEMINDILHNPAYAGAFVYGRTRAVRSRVSFRLRGRRIPQEEWKVIVKNQYPAYISWETYEEIIAILQDNRAEYVKKVSRGIPRDGSALLQGLMYCGKCGRKMVVQYANSIQYQCNILCAMEGSPMCQTMAAQRIDQLVTKAFFEAISPLEVDVYTQALQQRVQQQEGIEKAHQLELRRLQYEVDTTRRRYEKVDPENRLVASELERQWESALQALQSAVFAHEQKKLITHQEACYQIPKELRDSFESLGRSLPELWEKDTFKPSQKKALLRCLVEKVIVDREQPERVFLKIVWNGGDYSEYHIAFPVGSLKSLSNADELQSKVLEMSAEGYSDQEIAEELTKQGFRSPHDPTQLTKGTVERIRRKHRSLHRYKAPRHRHFDGFLTVPQVAQRLGFHVDWLYHQIRAGNIVVEKDSETGMYLFQDSIEILDQIKKHYGNSVHSH